MDDNGISRKPKVFMEQVSGTSRQPPELLKAIEYAASKPSKAFIIVRDFQRISRNWRYGAANIVPLFEADIPIVSVLRNSMSSTDKNVQDDDWLMAVFMGIGAQEVDQLKKRTLTGTRAAQKAGIFAGTPLSLYPEDAINPYAELVRFLPLMAAGELSGAEASRRLEKSTSWTRKTRSRLNGIMEMDKLDEWLSVIEKIRDMEIQHGQGFGKGASPRMKAVRRMTSGYIDNPSKMEAPTQSDLEEYYENYLKYQPKRQK